MTRRSTSLRTIQVDVTEGCYKVIERYAAMRGMTKSQVLFLALRYSMNREALERPEVRELFKEEGIRFDPEIAAEWRRNLEQEKTLEEIFTPIPAEAFKGRDASLIKIGAKYLLETPKNALDLAWRIAATVLLTSALTVGYGVVARPALVRAVIGLEEKRGESVELRLLKILEHNQTLERVIA